MGMHTSSMSMDKQSPSQLSWLGPMVNWRALRAQWRWPRSVMAQRPWPLL
jgi:hypothetical protein